MPDPDTVRKIVRGPWVGDLPPEVIGREARKRRRDFKGNRRQINWRLAEGLVERIEDHARDSGLRPSEVASLILWAYFNRQRRP